jgi:hypothetical protein
MTSFEAITARLCRFHPHRSKTVRGLLHWQYAGWFIAAFLPAGIAMAIDHRHGLAYSAFVVAGIWALCFWVASDFLEKKRKELDQKNVRKNPELRRLKRRSLLQWEWNVAAVIVFIVALFCHWTYGIRQDELTANLKKERDDLLDHLVATPVPFPSGGIIDSIAISIVNNAHPSIDRHVVTRTVFSFQSAGGSSATDSYIASPQVFSLGLLGGGRGESVDCRLLLSTPAPMICTELQLSINFTVEGQPDATLRKSYRYSYGRRGNGFDWFQPGMNSRDSCS